jgi:hypothetical protein
LKTFLSRSASPFLMCCVSFALALATFRRKRFTVSSEITVVQSSPIFMILEASLEKAVALIEQAADKGAKLVALSETWLAAIRRGSITARTPRSGITSQSSAPRRQLAAQLRAVR